MAVCAVSCPRRERHCLILHSGTLLAKKHAEGEDHAVSVCRLEELTLLEALSGAQLLFQTDFDFVELCLDLRA